MVMTHKEVMKQKAMPFFRKEDNPARLHMSYAEAVADNERIANERAKIADFQRRLRGEPEKTADNEKEIKIHKLEQELKEVKGVGAVAKREKIQSEINALKQ